MGFWGGGTEGEVGAEGVVDSGGGGGAVGGGGCGGVSCGWDDAERLGYVLAVVMEGVEGDSVP